MRQGALFHIGIVLAVVVTLWPLGVWLPLQGSRQETRANSHWFDNTNVLRMTASMKTPLRVKRAPQVVVGWHQLQAAVVAALMNA